MEIFGQKLYTSVVEKNTSCYISLTFISYFNSKLTPIPASKKFLIIIIHP